MRTILTYEIFPSCFQRAASHRTDRPVFHIKGRWSYDCCVPLTTLYEENGQNYVYVTDTENTVLGTVMVARKVEVTVQDRNQTTAALGEGSLLRIRL